MLTCLELHPRIIIYCKEGNLSRLGIHYLETGISANWCVCDSFAYIPEIWEHERNCYMLVTRTPALEINELLQLNLQNQISKSNAGLHSGNRLLIRLLLKPMHNYWEGVDILKDKHGTE